QFANPDVAVADIDTEVTNYQKIPLGVPVPRDGVLRTRLLEVLVRKNGAWWIVAFHNVAFAPDPAAPCTARQLPRSVSRRPAADLPGLPSNPRTPDEDRRSLTPPAPG